MNNEAKILELLEKAGIRGLTVTEIRAKIALNRVTIQKYFYALEKAGYIKVRVLGRTKLATLKKWG